MKSQRDIKKIFWWWWWEENEENVYMENYFPHQTYVSSFSTSKSLFHRFFWNWDVFRIIFLKIVIEKNLKWPPTEIQEHNALDRIFFVWLMMEFFVGEWMSKCRERERFRSLNHSSRDLKVDSSVIIILYFSILRFHWSVACCA